MPELFAGTTHGGGTAIAINKQNVPYVAYGLTLTGSNYVQFTLDKYNGTSWQNVFLNTGVIGSWMALTINKNNEPVYAYNWKMNVNFDMKVKTPALAGNISIGLEGYQPDFVVDKDNNIYMAYRGSGSSYVIYVQKFNGVSWEFVGPSTGISVNRSGTPRLALDRNNVLHLVYRDEIRETIDVLKFNGTSWALVGAAGFPGKVDQPDIAIDKDNVIYVSYNDYLGGNQTHVNYLGVTVQKFNGSSWELVGQRTFSTPGDITYGTQLVIGKNNVPYVVTNRRYSSNWQIEAYYFGPPTYPEITLPVTLQNFEVIARKKTVVINWSTATEINNDYFILERSQDGKRFSEMTRINGAGNSSSTIQYSCTDDRPLYGRSHYRLKQVDIDGNHSYSAVKTVAIQQDQQVQIFPANSAGAYNITVEKPARTMRIELFDMDGTLLYKASSVNATNTISLINFAKGIYLIKVSDGKQILGLQKS